MVENQILHIIAWIVVSCFNNYPFSTGEVVDQDNSGGVSLSQSFMMIETVCEGMFIGMVAMSLYFLIIAFAIGMTFGMLLMDKVKKRK